MPPARRDQKANANNNASTLESTATIQVPLTMTRDQTDLIFELTRRKLEAEMAAAKVEARLRRELMVKESEARVAALVAAASAATTPAVPAQRPMVDEEDDITVEVPTEILSITLRFAGLPQEEIVRIFPYSLNIQEAYKFTPDGWPYDSWQSWGTKALTLSYIQTTWRQRWKTLRSSRKSSRKTWLQAV